MLSEIQELYPKLHKDFLLNPKINSIFMIKNNGFEKIDYENFEIISIAIVKHNILSFDYKRQK